MKRKKTKKIKTTFWVCFDVGNPNYLWWYRTRKEARERYKEHKNNPNYATLKSPTKCVVIDGPQPPVCLCGR